MKALMIFAMFAFAAACLCEEAKDLSWMTKDTKFKVKEIKDGPIVIVRAETPVKGKGLSTEARDCEINVTISGTIDMEAAKKFISETLKGQKIRIGVYEHSELVHNINVPGDPEASKSHIENYEQRTIILPSGKNLHELYKAWFTKNYGETVNP